MIADGKGEWGSADTLKEITKCSEWNHDGPSKEGWH
jgi:hypothetical protein